MGAGLAGKATTMLPLSVDCPWGGEKLFRETIRPVDHSHLAAMGAEIQRLWPEAPFEAVAKAERDARNEVVQRAARKAGVRGICFPAGDDGLLVSYDDGPPIRRSRLGRCGASPALALVLPFGTTTCATTSPPS